MNFELIDNAVENAVIKVVGVGGGGGNAVKHMIASKVEGVEFICANTDAQALADVDCKLQLQLGAGITKGLGAGANPEVGRAAAIEDRDRIADTLHGADMVFITAGMGGGTGTGAAPVVAEMARELGVLTVAVVTRPFMFEGKKRMAVAQGGMKELQQHVDSLITIPNERLMEVLGRDTALLEAFKAANDVLLGAVQGIADLIIRPGMINLDFADVRTVMSEMGMAMMGTGTARGGQRASEAAERAIRSPLLDDVDLRGARGILVNVTAGENLSLGEFSEVGEVVREVASENATVVVGTVIDPDLAEELKVTVVATGLGVEDYKGGLPPSGSQESHHRQRTPLPLSPSGPQLPPSGPAMASGSAARLGSGALPGAVASGSEARSGAARTSAHPSDDSQRAQRAAPAGAGANDGAAGDGAVGDGAGGDAPAVDALAGDALAGAPGEGGAGGVGGKVGAGGARGKGAVGGAAGKPVAAGAKTPLPTPVGQEDYFDIPAFLRRQAD